MKKTVTIFLLCYFSLAALVPSMDFDRLYQIPDLAAHFLEHDKAQNGNIIDFIYEHYSDEAQQPTDGHELPFQKHDCNVVYLSFASFFSNTGSLVLQFPSAELKTDYQLQFPSQHFFDIWHPPRA